MTRTELCIRVFRDRLVQREDCFARQMADGNYNLIKTPITDGVILSHLQGKETVGLFPFANGTTKWLCIDIDTLVGAAVQTVQQRLKDLSIPYLSEFSGRKGFHLWVFFDRPYPSAAARKLGKALTQDHELFPKQEIVSEGRYGSLIKAPLGRHRVTGDWCLFVDDDLAQMEKPYEILAGVQTVGLDEVLRRCNLDDRGETREVSNGEEVQADNRQDWIFPPLLKDCVSHHLLSGTVSGRRNDTAHILASELRRVGLPESQTLRLLIGTWNLNNLPPLESKEIESVVQSVYRNQLFEYGCNPKGVLRKHLRCLGYSNCVYLSMLKEVNGGGQGKAYSGKAEEPCLPQVPGQSPEESTPTGDEGVMSQCPSTVGPDSTRSE